MRERANEVRRVVLAAYGLIAPETSTDDLHSERPAVLFALRIGQIRSMAKP